jgi:hypothetical protein
MAVIENFHWNMFIVQTTVATIVNFDHNMLKVKAQWL